MTWYVCVQLIKIIYIFICICFVSNKVLLKVELITLLYDINKYTQSYNESFFSLCLKVSCGFTFRNQDLKVASRIPYTTIIRSS